MADQALQTQTVSQPADPAKPVSAKPDAQKVEVKPGDKPVEAPKPEGTQEREARRIAFLKRETERVAAERVALAEKAKKQETDFGDLRKNAEEYKAIKELLGKNPLQALTKLGLDYDSLIKSEIERQELESNPAVKEIRELKARLAAEEQQRKDAELGTVKVAHQRQIDNAVREIQGVIEGNVEKYEFLKTAGAAKDVFQRIYDVFSETTKRDSQGRVIQPGKTLTAQEACDILESEYEESWKSIAGLKKVAAFFQSKPQEKPVQSTRNKLEEPRSPILSNSNTSGPVQVTRLTKKEKSARAFEAMRAASSR